MDRLERDGLRLRCASGYFEGTIAIDFCQNYRIESSTAVERWASDGINAP